MSDSNAMTNGKLPTGSAPRVLYILPQPFFACRGSAFRAQSTVVALRELGYDVDFLCLHLGEAVDLPGINLHRSGKIPGIRYMPVGPSWRKLLCDTALMLSATKLHLKRRYHIIHGVEEAGFIASALGAVRRIPFVFDMHSHMSEQIRDCGFIRKAPLLSAIECIERWAVRRASAVITVGETHRMRMLDVAPHVPVFSLPDLPLTDVSPACTEKTELFRREFQLHDRRVLLYTGNFHPYQGVELLLRSFAEFQRQQPSANVQLLLVGGDIRDEQSQRYRQLVQDLGVASHVTFTGQRPLDEMGSFMALADVLVSPRIDGANTPLKVYSYMAAGKPLVATRIDSHTQVLDDTLAHLGNPEPRDFAKALQAALDTSAATLAANAERIARCAAVIEERFSPRNFRGILDSAYRQALGLPPQQASQEPQLLRRAS